MCCVEDILLVWCKYQYTLITCVYIFALWLTNEVLCLCVCLFYSNHFLDLGLILSLFFLMKISSDHIIVEFCTSIHHGIYFLFWNIEHYVVLAGKWWIEVCQCLVVVEQFSWLNKFALLNVVICGKNMKN